MNLNAIWEKHKTFILRVSYFRLKVGLWILVELWVLI